jgi:KDO2-lipid IV(A) lauroyltransferase
MSEPWVRLGLWLFRQIARLPDRWVRRVGFALGDLLWWLARGRRDSALTNLALCFPQRTEARAGHRARPFPLLCGQLRGRFMWHEPAERICRLVGSSTSTTSMRISASR